MDIANFQRETLNCYKFVLFALQLVPIVGAPAYLNASGVPDEICADCPDDTVTDFSKTSHGLSQTTGIAQKEITCVSCHGPAVEHVEDGDVDKIMNPAKVNQFSGTPLCLSCHDDGHFDDWTFRRMPRQTSAAPVVIKFMLNIKKQRQLLGLLVWILQL